MGRPFLEKFADVQWEVSEDHLQAWKDGKTGYPIIDAAMRACAARGQYIITQGEAEVDVMLTACQAGWRIECEW